MATLQQRFWAKVNKAGPVPQHAPDLGPCWVWTASTDSDGYGQFRTEGHRVIKAYIQAWILDGRPRTPNTDLDHRCHRKLCVRVSHLRELTRSQNMQNYTKQDARNTSGFRGVSFHKHSGKWQAKTSINYKQHWCGLHDTPEEANQAIIELRRKLHTHNDLDRITS